MNDMGVYACYKSFYPRSCFAFGPPFPRLRRSTNITDVAAESENLVISHVSHVGGDGRGLDIKACEHATPLINEVNRQAGSDDDKEKCV